MQKKIPWGYIDNEYIPIEEFQSIHIDTNYLTGEEEIYHFKKIDEYMFFNNLDNFNEDYFLNF